MAALGLMSTETVRQVDVLKVHTSKVWGQGPEGARLVNLLKKLKQSAVTLPGFQRASVTDVKWGGRLGVMERIGGSHALEGIGHPQLQTCVAGLGQTRVGEQKDLKHRWMVKRKEQGGKTREGIGGALPGAGEPVTGSIV
jgi:hypothetical protein